MKLLILALCATFALAARKGCYSGEDCDSDECCVNKGLIHWFGGYCYKLSQKDQTCSPFGHRDSESSIYHFQCPCVEGLKCEGVKEWDIFKLVWRFHPQCVDENEEDTTVETEVTTEAEVTVEPEVTTEENPEE